MNCKPLQSFEIKCKKVAEKSENNNVIIIHHIMRYNDIKKRPEGY